MTGPAIPHDFGLPRRNPTVDVQRLEAVIEHCRRKIADLRAERRRASSSEAEQFVYDQLIEACAITARRAAAKITELDAAPYRYRNVERAVDVAPPSSLSPRFLTDIWETA